MKTERELVMDLSLLVARMARRLRRDGPTAHDAGDRALADQAVAYLQRHRLTSPLRDGDGVPVDAAQSQTMTVAELARRSGVKTLTVMDRIKEWGGGDVTLNQPINLIGLATAALAHGVKASQSLQWAQEQREAQQRTAGVRVDEIAARMVDPDEDTSRDQQPKFGELRQQMVLPAHGVMGSAAPSYRSESAAMPACPASGPECPNKCECAHASGVTPCAGSCCDCGRGCATPGVEGKTK